MKTQVKRDPVSRAIITHQANPDPAQAETDEFLSRFLRDVNDKKKYYVREAVEERRAALVKEIEALQETLEALLSVSEAMCRLEFPSEEIVQAEKEVAQAEKERL
jgi:hypothetical protein